MQLNWEIKRPTSPLGTEQSYEVISDQRARTRKMLAELMVLMNAAPDAIINGFQPQISSLLGNVTHSVSEFQKMSASEHMRRQRAKKRKEMAPEIPSANHPAQAFAQQAQAHIQTVTLARPAPAPASAATPDEEREKKRRMSIQALLSLDTGISPAGPRN